MQIASTNHSRSRSSAKSTAASTHPASQNPSSGPTDQVIDSTVLGANQTFSQESQLKELTSAQRQLDKAKDQVKQVRMRDEYELFCGRRNSKFGSSFFTPLLGMTAGLAAGIVVASSANNPAIAIPAFFGGPLLGLAGGALIENRAQKSYMDSFNSKMAPAQEQVDKWESVVNKLEQSES